jgi:polyisoprenoid-binding protein YceI
MANHTIHVTFKEIDIPPTLYTIVATAGSNGAINPVGEIEVTEGGSLQFTFTADSDYEIDEVLIDNVNNSEAVATGEYTFENVTENHTIHVTFKEIYIPPTLYTIVATAGENGTIDPVGEIEIVEGESLQFTFTADSNYEIDEVLIDNVNDSDAVATGEYTFENVTENHTIHVTFKEIYIPPTLYTIVATAGSNGAIDPIGEIEIVEGENQTFTFTADSDYEIDEVLIDNVNDSDAVATGEYTFENVTENHTIHVTFKEIYIPPTLYTIVATAGENGIIDPVG